MMDKLIDLQNIPNKDISEMILVLKDYPKYKSLVAMAVVGLPVPKTIIIGNLKEVAEDFCNKTISKWGVDEVSVRTDKIGGSVYAPSVQGCSLDKVWSEVKSFYYQGYLPMVISTGDIFHNTFSVNVVIDPDSPTNIYFEGVGPGFCASDINKRNVINESGTIVDGDVQNIYDHKVVGDEVYRHQIDLMMGNQIKKEEVSRGKQFKNATESHLWVVNFLKKEKALILNHQTYKPVGIQYIGKIWNFVPLMLKAGAMMGYTKEKFIVSMAYVLENGEEKPIFFDIHPYKGYKNG